MGSALRGTFPARCALSTRSGCASGLHGWIHRSPARNPGSPFPSLRTDRISIDGQWHCCRFLGPCQQIFPSLFDKQSPTNNHNTLSSPVKRMIPPSRMEQSTLEPLSPLNLAFACNGQCPSSRDQDPRASLVRLPTRLIQNSHHPRPRTLIKRPHSAPWTKSAHSAGYHALPLQNANVPRSEAAVQNKLAAPVGIQCE